MIKLSSFNVNLLNLFILSRLIKSEFLKDKVLLSNSISVVYFINVWIRVHSPTIKIIFKILKDLLRTYYSFEKKDKPIFKPKKNIILKLYRITEKTESIYLMKINIKEVFSHLK